MSTTSTSLLRETYINLDFFPNKWKFVLSPRFWAYSPYLEIKLETPNYILKTAKTNRELLSTFELRYRCFLEDSNQVNNNKLDIDDFDNICDHMIIQCKKTNKIIGTYRLISSNRSSNFYSQTEFDLSQFLSSPGGKLELGRACIDKDHRNGSVIDLLWKGIAEYMAKTNAKYLFGCSSIHSTRIDHAWKIFDLMEQENWIENKFKINPIGEFVFSRIESNIDPNDMKKFIPALLRSYIRAGAKVHAAPALDKSFSCIDFFTVFDIKDVSKLFYKRYFNIV